jgi:hypothetical protein
MKRATNSDQEKVVSILSQAFKENKSIQYIAGKEERKINFLMQYSFANCLSHGDVFISEDGESCALIQFFDKKKFSLNALIWDLKLILKTVGIFQCSEGSFQGVLYQETLSKGELCLFMVYRGQSPKTR